MDYWRNRLGKAERLILETLTHDYPAGLNKEEVAAQAGYEANGGGFNNALGRLRTLELVRSRRTQSERQSFRFYGNPMEFASIRDRRGEIRDWLHNCDNFSEARGALLSGFNGITLASSPALPYRNPHQVSALHYSCGPSGTTGR